MVLDKTLESPLDCKEIQSVHSKWDQSWMFFGRTDAKAETPIFWPPHMKSWLIGKDSDAGGGLGAGGEGDDRGWDGWMASPTRWMWVWVNSGSWWWTRRPGVQQFMGLQRVGHDWATELNWKRNILQFSSVAQSCLTLCNAMECNTPGFPIHHYLPELAQTQAHLVGDAIQPSHPLSSPSPPGFDLS